MGSIPGLILNANFRHLFIGINLWKVEIIFLFLSSTSIISSIIQSCHNLRSSKRNFDQRKLFEIKFAQSESVLMALNSNNFYMEIPNCQFDCISRLPANNCENHFLSLKLLLCKMLFNTMIFNNVLRIEIRWFNIQT